MSHPPIVGPIAGANVTVSPKIAPAIERCAAGMRISMMVNAVGISTPPVNPCPTRNKIISFRLVAVPHSTENTRNSDALTIK